MYTSSERSGETVLSSSEPWLVAENPMCWHCQNYINLCLCYKECQYKKLSLYFSCKKTSYIVYHGDRCNESTATEEFVLALSLGIGGGLIFILAVIIIFLCVRRCREKESRARYKYSKTCLKRSVKKGQIKDLNDKL